MVRLLTPDTESWLTLDVCSAIGLETRMLVQDIPHLVSSAVVASQQTQSFTSETQLSIAEPPSPRTAYTYLEPSPRRPRKIDCTVRHCHCSCHSVRRSSARFWAFEYTAPTTFSGKCSNPKCTAASYRWDLQFALSRYGIPFMVKAGVEFIAGSGTYSLRPALSTERVVKYTSDGFKALAQFERGLLTLPEVQEKFRDLSRRDASLSRHIHPGGRNYVQVRNWTIPCVLIV